MGSFGGNLQGSLPPSQFGPYPGWDQSFGTQGGDALGALSHDQRTGAARSLGSLGEYPIGQVDVRTPMMKALEMAAFPLLAGLLTNPGQISGMLGGMAPGSDLLSMIFGGGSQGGMPGGGGGQPGGGMPGGGGNGGGFPPGPPPAGPGMSPEGGWPTGPVAPGTGYAGGDGYNPLGASNGPAPGTPIAGGPYKGLPAGAPMPTPRGYKQHGAGPIDETGSRFKEITPDPRLDPRSTQNQFSRWAHSLGGARPAGQSEAAFTMPPELAALFGGRGQTAGDAASLVGDLIKMSPNLREQNLTAEQSLQYANQLWGALPGEQQAHVARNSASIYGGGGSNPTLMAFFQDKFKPGMMSGDSKVNSSYSQDGKLARANAITAEQGSADNAAMFERIKQRRGGIQSRALGGPLDPTATTIVGEFGPELISPQGPTGQQVIPLHGGMPAMPAPQIMGAPRDPRRPPRGAPGGMPTPMQPQRPGTPMQPGGGGTPKQRPGAPVERMPRIGPGKPEVGVYGGGMTNMMAPVAPGGAGGGMAYTGGSATFDERTGQYTQPAPGIGPFMQQQMGGGDAMMPPAGGGMTPGGKVPGPFHQQRLARMGQQQPPGSPSGVGVYNGGMTNVMAPGGAPGVPQTQPGAASGGNPMGMLAQQLQNNPEQDVFNQIRQMLTGGGGILGSPGGAGQQVMNAMQPVFQQNLGFGLNQLANRAPSVQNSAHAVEGADLTSRALNDFNLMAAQTMLQGQQNTLQGMNTLGGLAGQAGNGAFNRTMGAGQLGMQMQQQQWNQSVGPMLQLLMAALGMATPTGYQTIVPGKKD